VAENPNFRFFGNVEFGRHLNLDDLKDHYHQIFFATGAQTDRHMGIPGEDLRGSHPATEFVAWYNGHPDFLTAVRLVSGRVAVVGVGNVAVVWPHLYRTPEIHKVDMADYAEALNPSRVKNLPAGPARLTRAALQSKNWVKWRRRYMTLPEVQLDLGPGSWLVPMTGPP
jgi:ferredoxin--NADP+ reductase